MQPLRRIVAASLAIVFVLLVASSALVFIMPPPAVAQWTDWNFMWISWRRIQAMHLGLGIAVIVLGLASAALNFDSFLTAWRDQEGRFKPFGVAPLAGLGLAVIVAAISALMLPPMRQVLDIANKMQADAAAQYGEAPFDRAWRASLTEFCAKTGLDLDKVVNTLAAKHVVVATPDQTVEDIARKNGISPAGIYDSVRPLKAEAAPGGKPSALPLDPPAGLGRMTLAEVCASYGLDTTKIAAKLNEMEIRAGAPMTIADMAKVNNRLPVEIYDALKLAAANVSQPKAAEAKAVKPGEPAPAQPGQPAAGQPAQPAETPAQPGPAQPAAATQPGPAVQTVPTGPGTPAQPAQKIEPPVGLGKMMISEFCKTYNIDQKEAIRKLEAKNITAFGDMTFNEIALENNLTPKVVMDIVTN